jgi:hypothetical protein
LLGAVDHRREMLGGLRVRQQDPNLRRHLRTLPPRRGSDFLPRRKRETVVAPVCVFSRNGRAFLGFERGENAAKRGNSCVGGVVSAKTYPAHTPTRVREQKCTSIMIGANEQIAPSLFPSSDSRARPSGSRSAKRTARKRRFGSLDARLPLLVGSRRSTRSWAV